MNNLETLNNKQLIPIKENENGEVIISGRDLYKFLKVQQDFSDWIKKQLEMIDAKEDRDFICFPFKREGNNATLTEYVLKIDSAKEICMIAGIAPRTNDDTKRLSKEARQYFIQIEKAWNSPEMIMKRALEIANKQVEKLQLENVKKDQVIGELKPKADYTDIILKNKGLIAVSKISKDYGMSAIKFNRILHDLGIQFKQSDQWLLYSKYHDKGYTHSETTEIIRSDGRKDTKMNTKWTQKGRLFLYNLLKDNGILPNIEKQYR